MELTPSKGSGKTVFLVTVPFFLPKGHDLKAMVGIQKVFVKSMKNVLTSCINFSCSVTSKLLLFIIIFSNKNRKCYTLPLAQTDPSAAVSELLCSMIWFNSIPGAYIGTNTLGGIRIKRRKNQHTA